MRASPRKSILWPALGLVLTLILVPAANAVVLDDESRTEVVLEDGTNIILYARAGSSPGRTSKDYYALPTGLRLSQKPDGSYKFLFLKFTTDEREEEGGISGALLHFLTTWGLSPEQHDEVEAKLRKERPGAVFKGAVPLEPDDQGGSYRIISATLSDETMTPSVVNSGRAPLVPGGQAATAARLNADGAQLLAATFEKTSSITDLSINLNYTFTTLVPAARGYILVDWSKVERESETLEAEYKKWQSGKKTKEVKVLGLSVYKSSKPTYSYSYDEMRREYEFLREKQVIQVHFDQLRDGEATQKIQDAFFQFFLNMVAETGTPEDGVPPPPSDQEKEKMPNIRYGNSYKYKQSFVRQVNERKTQKLVLSARTTVRWPVSMTENLTTWVEDLRAHKKYMASVNLADPFFQHRDIRFILDLEAKEIFDERINYVTVNVRKKRSSGPTFEDHITIDQRYLEENGVTAAVTYARGDDENPDLYEYQAQWSLKGGELYPENPPWQKGSWEGVTLAPPVALRTLEVEADLDELEAAEITRATVEVHYPRFGEEVQQNIHISPARGEPLVEQRIFTDRDAPGYAYRLILNHKRDGKLVLPWSAQLGDDYIFVTLPEELLEEGSEVRELAKQTAKEMLDRGQEKVLDRFEQLLKESGR